MLTIENDRPIRPDRIASDDNKDGMGQNRRKVILRQAGLIELCAQTQGTASCKIGLIDGAVNGNHPTFRDCRISRFGDSPSARASDHATFNASILLAGEADQQSGRVMALCSGCTVLNYAVVTDDMLTGAISSRQVAKSLATTVHRAIQAMCRIIVLGIEIRDPESSAWTPLRNALCAARAAGSIVIFPAGNRSGSPNATACRWPEALVALSCDWRGARSRFSPLPGRRGNTLFAPGEHVPGAGSDSGYAIRSGTSFAAVIAAGAFGLMASLFPDRSVFNIAATLCPPPYRVLTGISLSTPLILRSDIGGL